MSITIKCLITIVVCIIALAIGFMNPAANHAGSDKAWKLGARDPLRNLVFQQNGAFRRFTKFFVLVWLTLGVCLLWIAG